MKPSICSAAFCALALWSSAAAVSGAEIGLPDPLLTADGARITSAAQWKSQRRAEILELFRVHVYGLAPVGRPDSLRFTVTDSKPGMMDGKAQRQLVDISFAGPGGTGVLHLVLFTPGKARKPVPCFLLINNRGAENIDPDRILKSPFWPAELIVDRGYAAAAFLNSDIAADNKESFQTGVHKVFGTSEDRKPDTWGTIAAWAWGASRVLDYLETNKDIDAKRVAVVGHSRGGKTALWAGAEDERFGMVISNDSGCAGAAITRGKRGERIGDITRAFPYWFCENFRKYAGREEDLPIDQHMLLALSAPRLLYVASASEDIWADPNSEFDSAAHASPVYRLLGHEGLGAITFPGPDAPIHNGRIGYHVRTGKHNLTEYDWSCYLDFAAKHGW